MKKSILAATFSLIAMSTAYATTHPIVQNSDHLHWVDSTALPGAKIAILAGNPAKKQPFVARIKMPANYQVPIHSHPINEYDTVLSGTMYLELNHHTQTLPAGSFAMIPAKMWHRSWTKTATILQINGVGPWGMKYPKHS